MKKTGECMNSVIVIELCMIVSVRMMILFMSVYDMYYFTCSPGCILCSPLILIPFPVYLVYIDNVIILAWCSML